MCKDSTSYISIKMKYLVDFNKSIYRIFMKNKLTNLKQKSKIQNSDERRSKQMENIPCSSIGRLNSVKM